MLDVAVVEVGPAGLAAGDIVSPHGCRAFRSGRPGTPATPGQGTGMDVVGVLYPRRRR